jgi:hypothetical protein
MALVKSSVVSRSAVLLCLGLLVVVLAASVSGNPLPEYSKDDFNKDLDSVTQSAKNFFDRLANFFKGKAGLNEPDGLTTWELVGVIAVAVVLLLIIPCCIMCLLCECVKELVCCICCCRGCD